MTHRKRYVGVWLLATLILSRSACRTDEIKFSSTPAIEYKSVRKYALNAGAGQARRDSVVVSLAFQDGDGDLGEDPRDTARLKQTFANQPWGNYQIRQFAFVNGRYEEVIVPANVKLFFPPTTTKRGALAGLLDFGQSFPYGANARPTLVKFQIRLRDRQLNESNVVETDTVRVPLN